MQSECAGGYRGRSSVKAPELRPVHTAGTCDSILEREAQPNHWAGDFGRASAPAREILAIEVGRGTAAPPTGSVGTDLNSPMAAARNSSEEESGP